MAHLSDSGHLHRLMEVFNMDAETRRRVEANLFPAARGAVEPWEEFPWHYGRNGTCDTWVAHSSQALAIDVFGTLKCLEDRSAVMDKLALAWGLPRGGKWEVELEMTSASRVGEPRPTQVDAVAWNEEVMVFFECKFTESDGGSCPQTRPLTSGANKGMIQCNGSYEFQVNPVNGLNSRCSLSAKGIGYWEHIPSILFIDADTDYRPCPFAGAWYQWMRNCICCWVEARRRGLRAAFVLAYADAPGIKKLPVASELASPRWSKFRKLLKPDAVAVTEVSFLEMIRLGSAVTGPDAGVFADLSVWVEEKIRRVASATP